MSVLKCKKKLHLPFQKTSLLSDFQCLARVSVEGADVFSECWPTSDSTFPLYSWSQISLESFQCPLTCRLAMTIILQPFLSSYIHTKENTTLTSGIWLHACNSIWKTDFFFLLTFPLSSSLRRDAFEMNSISGVGVYWVSSDQALLLWPAA